MASIECLVTVTTSQWWSHLDLATPGSSKMPSYVNAFIQPHPTLPVVRPRSLVATGTYQMRRGASNQVQGASKVCSAIPHSKFQASHCSSHCFMCDVFITTGPQRCLTHLPFNHYPAFLFEWAPYARIVISSPTLSH